MINHFAAQVWPQKHFLFRADYFQSSTAFKVDRSATAFFNQNFFYFKKQLKFSTSIHAEKSQAVTGRIQHVTVLWMQSSFLFKLS